MVYRKNGVVEYWSGGVMGQGFLLFYITPTLQLA